jgi:hypothetical protein
LLLQAGWLVWAEKSQIPESPFPVFPQSRPGAPISVEVAVAKSDNSIGIFSNCLHLNFWLKAFTLQRTERHLIADFTAEGSQLYCHCGVTSMEVSHTCCRVGRELNAQKVPMSRQERRKRAW